MGNQAAAPRKGISLQYRLPLLIFILLLSSIVLFTWISYIGVRNAAIKTGQQRLVSLSQQLSSMFGQSAQTLVSSCVTAAGQPAVQNFMHSRSPQDEGAATAALKKLMPDPATVMVALLDSNRKIILSAVKDSLVPRTSLDSLCSLPDFKLETGRVGKLYFLRDSMYFPVIVPVTTGKQLSGYVAKWRMQYSTPKSIEQFSQLLGDATLYIANSDGSLWTDLARTIPPRTGDSIAGKAVFQYSAGGKKMVAASAPVPSTSWIAVVEFPRAKMLEAPGRFLRRVMLAGALLILAGLVISWLISRSITGPLKKLTAASAAVAAGDYSQPIDSGRSDEIGELGRTFNHMAQQVGRSQQDLEEKIRQRTTELETANKELEAFSYTVSHDLRAPLRAINGYAIMLKEDYAASLDEEANRLADKIIGSARKMGRLIDDLITFSQMSSRELMSRQVNMQRLAEECVTECLANQPQGKYTVSISDLVPCAGDENLLKQVWTNLVSNAIKYSAHTIHPVIEIGSTEKEGVITYFIRDNGAGFDMKYAHKLFGVFQRLHKPNEFEGTGIGLAFVKRIISRHHGYIRAEGAVGKGAAFYFDLPKTN